jgi:hypothetical protein
MGCSSIQKDEQPFVFGYSPPTINGMRLGQQHSVAVLFLKGIALDTDSLRKIYIQSAHIVSRYGDKYLPIFERLEEEYNLCRKKDALLTKAQSISIDNEVD